MLLQIQKFFSRIKACINTCLECEIYAENEKKFLSRYLLPFLSPNMASQAVNMCLI